MLTQNDFDEIEKLVRDIVKEEIKFLPTRDEFFTKMAELMGEVKAMRESQEIHAGTHTEINDRLEKLEKALQSSI